MLFDNCNKDIDTHGDPDLRLDGVGCCAEELFDSQMLLDPLEEQFHHPSATIQHRNRQGGDVEQVGQEHQLLAGIGIVVPNPP